VITNKYITGVDGYDYMIFLSFLHFLCTSIGTRILLGLGVFQYKDAPLSGVLPVSVVCMHSHKNTMFGDHFCIYITLSLIYPICILCSVALYFICMVWYFICLFIIAGKFALSCLHEFEFIL
jgi:hypothetical protein